MTWTKETDLGYTGYIWESRKNNWIGEYWIGLKKNSDGKWMWDHESGKPLRQNSDLGWWKTEEPNNANGNEGCAAVGWGGSMVADIKCNEKKPVLCVKSKLFYQVSIVH